jgi:hypothetical protein
VGKTARRVVGSGMEWEQYRIRSGERECQNQWNQFFEQGVSNYLGRKKGIVTAVHQV